MPAGGGDELGPGADEVGEHAAVRGLDYSAVGNADDDVATVCAVAMRAGAGFAQRPAVKVEQRGHARVHPKNDVTAATAVAAVGPAERLELLAVYRSAAVTTVTGL